MHYIYGLSESLSLLPDLLGVLGESLARLSHHHSVQTQEGTYRSSTKKVFCFQNNIETMEIKFEA